jgi:hypothetical protein
MTSITRTNHEKKWVDFFRLVRNSSLACASEVAEVFQASLGLPHENEGNPHAKQEVDILTSINSLAAEYGLSTEGKPGDIVDFDPWHFTPDMPDARASTGKIQIVLPPIVVRGCEVVRRGEWEGAK